MRFRWRGSRRSARRRGVASLEFVLVFPVLLMLVAAIFWVASVCCAQSDAVIAARAAAWVARYDDRSAEAFNFKATGEVRRTETRRSAFQPLFLRSMTPTPRSVHLVLAGTWDHNAVSMDRPPHWKVAETMLSKLPGQVGSNALDTVKDIGRRVNASQILDDVRKNVIEQQYSGPLEQFKGWWKTITGHRDSLKEKERSKSEAALKDLPTQIAAHQRTINDLQEKIKGWEVSRQQIQTEIDTRRDSVSGKELDEKELGIRRKRLADIRNQIEDAKKRIEHELGQRQSEQKSLEQVQKMRDLTGP